MFRFLKMRFLCEEERIQTSNNYFHDDFRLTAGNGNLLSISARRSLME